MAENEGRRPRGRRGRRPSRELIFADTDSYPDDELGWHPYDELGGDGSAGVREPRNPLPKPVSGAGERPEPEPPLVAVLPDPRY